MPAHETAVLRQLEEKVEQTIFEDSNADAQASQRKNRACSLFLPKRASG
jgi:hypothetical protein